MEHITKEDFEAWMMRILDKLDRTDEKLDEVLSSRIALNGDELLDNQNLIELLKVSHRTLQRYRTDGKLPYCRHNGKATSLAINSTCWGVGGMLCRISFFSGYIEPE